MPSYIPPLKNTAFVCYVALTSQADTKKLQVAPTLAAGDVQVSIDGGAFANLTTLPVVTPGAGTAVKVSLSAGEMNGDNIVVAFIDQAGAEWCDLLLTIQTAGQQVNDLSTAAAVAAVAAKTNNLPAAPADETTSAAVKLQTDKLQFDASNRIKADVMSINNTVLTGDGTVTTPWGPV